MSKNLSELTNETAKVFIEESALVIIVIFLSGAFGAAVGGQISKLGAIVGGTLGALFGLILFISNAST